MLRSTIVPMTLAVLAAGVAAAPTLPAFADEPVVHRSLHDVEGAAGVSVYRGSDGARSQEPRARQTATAPEGQESRPIVVGESGAWFTDDRGRLTACFLERTGDFERPRRIVCTSERIGR